MAIGSETPINQISKADIVKKDLFTVLLIACLFFPYYRPDLVVITGIDTPIMDIVALFIYFTFYSLMVYISCIIYWKLIKQAEIPSWFWLVGRKTVFNIQNYR